MASYQGPVPPGADEQKFRDTGKTESRGFSSNNPTFDKAPGQTYGNNRSGGKGRKGSNNKAQQQRQAEAERLAELEKEKQRQEQLKQQAQAELQEQQKVREGRVFFAKEQGHLSQGKFIPNQEQFKPKDFNADKDTIVYYGSGGKTTGRSEGRVQIEAGINIKNESGQAVAREIKQLASEPQEKITIETTMPERVAEPIQRDTFADKIMFKDTFFGKAVDKYKIAENYVSSKITTPLFNKLGINSLATSSVYSNPVTLPLTLTSKKAREFQVGIASGILTDVRDKPLKNVLLFGGGKAVGLGVQGTGRLLSMIPKVGTKVGSSFRTLEVVGGTGLGGIYAIKTINNMRSSGSTLEAGKIFGTSTKDALLFGSGYKSGQKDFLKLQGLKSTRGRAEVFPLTKDITSGQKRFVENPTGRINAKEYLNLFKYKSQVVPGIKEPVAYHQTPNIFYGKELKVTKRGSSEFPGLYGAYRPSPHFLKVGGSSSSINFNVKSLIKNIFTPYGKPGTAGIIPTKFIIGKSAKPGQAFIPAIKPEVEAIFPVGTSANLINKGTYYKFNDIRIPIDIFKATGEKTGEVAVSDLLKSPDYSSPSKTRSVFSSVSALDSSSYKSSTNSVFSTPKTSSYKSNTSSISSLTKPSYSGSSRGSSSGKGSSSYGGGSGSSSSGGSSITSLIGSPSGKSRTPSYPPRPYYSSPPYSPPPRYPNKSRFKSALKIPKQSKEYSVFGRRRGKFNLIGKTSSINKAFQIGKGFGDYSLGRTFSIKSSDVLSGLRTPKGYYRKQGKFGNLFIEKSKYALNTRSERKALRQSRKRLF